MSFKQPTTIRDPQAVILDAVAKGLTTCTLPAGTWTYGKTVFVPGGTSGLTISAEGVTLRSDGRFTGALFAVGRNTTTGLATDTGIVNYASRTVVDGAVGRDDTDPNATGLTVGYNVLSDPDVYTTYDNGGSPATAPVLRELVYIASDSAFGRQPTRLVSGGTGQGHAYGTSSYYIPVNSYATYNLTITGKMVLDGSNHPTGYAARLTSIWFVDGLTEDLVAQYFLNEGITTAYCRNKTTNVTADRYSSGDEGGEGYSRADYAIFNAELYSENGQSGDPAFLDIGSSSKGIRHCWYKAYGVADCYQHDFKATDCFDNLADPIFEVGAHVGPGEYCTAENLTATGTARGCSGGGHQLFGYGDTANTCSNIEVNGGDFLQVACKDFDFHATGVRNWVLIGMGDRTGLTTGAFPEGPDGTGDGAISGDCQRLFTGTGYQANQERLEGTLTINMDIDTDSQDAQAVRLRSEANCTITFTGGTYICRGTVFRVCDIGAGAGSVTLNVSNSAFQLTDASNDREAFQLLTTGTVNTVSANSFTSAANPSPNFMTDAGTWTGETTDPDP